MDASDDLEYISEVFKAINKVLEDSGDKRASSTIIEAFKTAQIFPINTGISNSAFDYLGTAHDLDMWFIADRPHFKESFEGIVPLLALGADAVTKIQTTIDALGLSGRLLTRLADAVTETSGPTQKHLACTTWLRGKANHIARYVFQLPYLTRRPI